MYLFYKHNKEEQRTNYPFFQCSYTLKKGPDGRRLGTNVGNQHFSNPSIYFSIVSAFARIIHRTQCHNHLSGCMTLE